MQNSMRAAAVAALTVALSGCPAPAANNPAQPPAGQATTPGQTTPGGQAQPGGQTPSGGQTSAGSAEAKAAGSEGAQATAEALGDEQTADDVDLVADEGAPAGYELAQAPTTTAAPTTTQAPAQTRADARAAAKVKIGAAIKAKMLARRDALRAAAKARLTKKLGNLADEVKAALQGATETKNEDGSTTRTVTVTKARTAGKATGEMKLTITRTRNADGVLVFSRVERTHTLSNGATLSMWRERTVDENGVATVTLHRERTTKAGAKWVTDWTKTISAEGEVSGSGQTVVTKDGKTKTLTHTLSGKEDAPKATAADAATGASAEVAVGAGGDATATVNDGTGAAAATVSADAEAVAGADT